MPKKPGDRVTAASLANLSPESGKKENRDRLSCYVLPATKGSLSASRLAAGEAIDVAEFVRSNVIEIQTGIVQLGLIRLVNPDRGRIWCADIKTEHGTLSARTGSKPKTAFEQWDVYHCVGSNEFYCGRSFSRRELMRWFSASTLNADEQLQENWLGSIPANIPDPQQWKWYAFTQSETVLEQEYKPSRADFQKVAGYALSMRPEEFYPLLDCYEIWLCDQETLQPLALALTANSREQIDTLNYSPMWRFCIAAQHETETRSLEKTVNERINTATQPGRWGFHARVFQRHLDGSATEYLLDGSTREHTIGYLPVGELTEPFEQHRLELLQTFQRN